MDREIKFRAWDGEQLLYRGLCDRNWYDAEDKLVREALPEDAHNWKIMECAGFRDGSNTEIYEGDIVIGDYYKLATVEFARGRFRLDVKKKKWQGPPWRVGFAGTARDLKVIGNIYENPAMLKMSQ